jgi:hypothetical protein
MAKSIHERGLLRPGEVAKLQRIFDEARKTRDIVDHSTEARDLALNILALHNAGMRDEKALLAAVSFRRATSKPN